MKIITYRKYDGRKHFLTKHVMYEMSQRGFQYFQVFIDDKKPRTEVKNFVNTYFKEEVEDIELVVYTSRKGVFKDFVEVYVKFKNDKK